MADGCGQLDDLKEGQVCGYFITDTKFGPLQECRWAMVVSEGLVDCVKWTVGVDNWGAQEREWDVDFLLGPQDLDHYQNC